MSDGKNFENVIIQEKLESPSSFPFPFTPYGIQHDFMTKLYSALENKKLGIFESPTGTVSDNIKRERYKKYFKYRVYTLVKCCLYILYFVFDVCVNLKFN